MRTCLACQATKGTPLPTGGERWFDITQPVFAGPFCSTTCVGAFRNWPTEKQMFAVIKDGGQLASLIELRRQWSQRPVEPASTHAPRWRELRVVNWKSADEPPPYIATSFRARFRLELDSR